jgi:hypothetical protein
MDRIMDARLTMFVQREVHLTSVGPALNMAEDVHVNLQSSHLRDLNLTNTPPIVDSSRALKLSGAEQLAILQGLFYWTNPIDFTSICLLRGRHE